MDVVLVTVTIAAMLFATGMAVVAWRLVRGERERSAARVAALESAIDDDRPLSAVPAAWEDTPVVTTGAPVTASPDLTRPGGLFSTPSPEQHGLARLLPAVLAGVLIVGAVISAAVMFSSGNTTASAAAAREPRPLELLSLRHAVNDGSLSVTGLVRNPAGNPDLERVTAIVFLFDDKGGFLASSRAPLDFTSIGSGEESPFVVTLTAPPGVARYRVSFRRDQGGVLPHLDRREARTP